MNKHLQRPVFLCTVISARSVLPPHPDRLALVGVLRVSDLLSPDLPAMPKGCPQTVNYWSTCSLFRAVRLILGSSRHLAVMPPRSAAEASSTARARRCICRRRRSR